MKLQVTVQAQVVMNVSGSKHWEDGEGWALYLGTLHSALWGLGSV